LKNYYVKEDERSKVKGINIEEKKDAISVPDLITYTLWICLIISMCSG
jgi:hypothetical protein